MNEFSLIEELGPHFRWLKHTPQQRDKPWLAQGRTLNRGDKEIKAFGLTAKEAIVNLKIALVNKPHHD